MSADDIQYDVLSERLREAGSAAVLAELHGSLCGMFCGGGRAAAGGWLNQCCDDGNDRTQARDALASDLTHLADVTWQALTGLVLEFSPLLPDDEADIEDRVAALALWCHGFLTGLVAVGVDLSSTGGPITDEIREVAADFSEISKAGVDADELHQPDVAEASFTELMEYVRVSAQLVFEEFGQAASVQPETVH